MERLPLSFLGGDMISVFDAVKSNVTTRQAVELYGVKLNRGGFARCPFHADDSPSFKVYEDGFFCFGCHEHGDVIDFVSKLFSLDAKEAADKLAADFGIVSDSMIPSPSVRQEHCTEQKDRDRYNDSWNILCDYLHLLKAWRKQFEPDREDQEWHPLFCEALQNADRVDYLLDCLWDCPASKAPALLEQIGGEVDRYRARIEQTKGSENYG